MTTVVQSPAKSSAAPAPPGGESRSPDGTGSAGVARRLAGWLAGWLDAHLHLLMVIPGIGLVLGVVAYPVGWNLVNSLTNKSTRFPITNFVGLDNYTALVGDPAFWSSVTRTVGWTVASVLGQLVLGLVAALALQHIRRGQGPMRMALLIPWAFPSIVLAFNWRFMLNGLNGVVNDVLLRMGLIDAPAAWLSDTSTAMASIVVMNIWFGFPFMMIALLAGLQTIPQEVYDSSSVDGASFWQQTIHITLPMLKQLIGALVLLRAIWVFNNFDFVFLTTGGGPVNATETLSVYAYKIGWSEGNLGKMAAASTVLILGLAIVGLTSLVARRRRHEYR